MIRPLSIHAFFMRIVGRSVLGALLATVAAVPGDASAASGRAWLATYNNYPNRSMWVTIYDLGKTRHLDYGCVGANAWRSWESGNYAYGSFYYIRAELKEDLVCGGKTLCDTTVQVNPQYAGYILPEFAGKPDPNPVTLVPNGNNCLWLKGHPSASIAPAVTVPPAPPSPAVPVCTTKWGADLTDAEFKAGKPIADPGQEFNRYMRVHGNRAWWCKQNRKVDCSAKVRSNADYCACFNGC